MQGLLDSATANALIHIVMHLENEFTEPGGFHRGSTSRTCAFKNLMQPFATSRHPQGWRDSPFSCSRELHVDARHVRVSLG